MLHISYKGKDKTWYFQQWKVGMRTPRVDGKEIRIVASEEELEWLLDAIEKKAEESK